MPGSARRWRTPSGKVISRYEYDSRRLRAASGGQIQNRYQAEQLRATKEWRAWSFKIRAAGGRTSIFDAELTKAIAQVEYERQVLGEADDSPDGALAYLLGVTGVRDPDWTWNVGDTPKGTRA